MANLMSTTEQANVLSTIDDSFDTWSREIIVYKEAVKVAVTPAPTTADNPFGFGESQHDPIYTYSTPRSASFFAIIKNMDIESPISQVRGMALSPEIISRILANPISMKVRKSCKDFIEDGPTERVFDPKTSETYLINGHFCLQTYQGSEYYVYPLRKTN